MKLRFHRATPLRIADALATQGGEYQQAVIWISRRCMSQALGFTMSLVLMTVNLSCGAARHLSFMPEGSNWGFSHKSLIPVQNSGINARQEEPRTLDCWLLPARHLKSFCIFMVVTQESVFVEN